MRAIAVNKSTGKEFDISDIVVDTLGAEITEENSAEAVQIAFEWAIDEFGFDNADAGLEE